MNRMRGLVLGILVLLIHGKALPQADTLSLDKGFVHRLVIEASGAYDSDALPNELVQRLYLGGEVDAGVRWNTLDRLGAMNRAGYGLQGRISYVWGGQFLGRPKLAPRLSVSGNSHLGMRFPKDVYAVTFFGNKGFEERTAHLGEAAFTMLSFQGVGFGFTDRKSGSFLELGVVNGMKLNMGRITKADLFTAADGRYLEVDLDGRYARSDTSAGWSSGVGAALSFEWRTGVKLFGRPARIALGADDLGFIAWNASSLSVDKDSVLHYDGIRLHGIMDLDDLIVNEQSLQDSLGLGYAPGNISTALPALLHARIDLGPARTDGLGQDRYLFSLGVDQRLLPGYRPHVLFKSDLPVNGRLNLQAGVGHGGLGGTRLLLGLDAQLGNHLILAIGTANMIGVASQKAKGKALAVELEMAW